MDGAREEKDEENRWILAVLLPNLLKILKMRMKMTLTSKMIPGMSLTNSAFKLGKQYLTASRERSLAVRLATGARPGEPYLYPFKIYMKNLTLIGFIITSKRIEIENPAMYQTKGNFKGFPMVIYLLMLMAQSYGHSCLSRTKNG